ncbi:uncharacterized protein BP5553_04238 [Venustampulla echinocandica]|uniref:Uncharacterized protein n=1 Tax=Venustampulla echinocandica TaxID=2656787 RepID=A0A370TWP9_9HELO|nr:uncharacterized protein BP5553_04238 [Venustampulla echinocandica]RDL39898.1 hypothetical protein BP5553_04238 [Venustampulla echinocandica]
MSFGVDQAITALGIAFDICMKVKNAPEEIEEVKKATTRTKHSLHILKTRMVDPSSPFNNADARIKLLLSGAIKDIEGGVENVEAIIKERLAIPWWEIGSYTSWLLIRVPKLKLIAQSFDVSGQHIQEVVQYIQTDAIQKIENDIGEEGKKAAKRAKQQEEKLRKIEKKAEAAEAALRKSQADVSKLLALVEKNPNLVANAAVHGGESSDKSKEAWIEELVNGGMPRHEAKSRLEDMMKTVRSEHDKMAAQPPKNLTHKSHESKPVPVKETKPATVKETKPATVKKTKPATVKEAKPATIKEAKPVAVKETKVTKHHVSILVVDADNGERSIITQTYLELVRSWTMNTQKTWLFNRVHSAGTYIPTKFTKEHIGVKDPSTLPVAGIPASKAAISEVAGPEYYFWSKNPDEKDTILERMRHHKSCGLEQRHFQQFDYILCFDEGSQKWLEKMKAIAVKNTKTAKGKPPPKVISNIHYLKGSEEFGAASKKTLHEVSEKIKVATKAFLTSEFGWERSHLGIAQGQWRTLQFIVSKEVSEKIVKIDKELKSEIEAMNWRVHTCTEYLDKTVLVSVSGPREMLEMASKMIIDP